MKRRTSIVLTLLLAGGLFVAAETTLPHDFAPGDVLSAAAMNENFGALAGAVDALAGITQRRVADACPAGSSIRAIGEDGAVTCEEVAASPGPPGEDGASVRAELAGGELTVCNDAGSPAESCTTETVAGEPGSDGADGVSGYEIYEETTDFSSPIEAGSTFTFGRVCPDEKLALGGGGYTSQVRVVLARSSPSNNGRGWTVNFYNPTGEDLDIEFTITIVCADVT